MSMTMMRTTGIHTSSRPWMSLRVWTSMTMLIGA